MHKSVCDLCSKRGIAGLCPTQELEAGAQGPTPTWLSRKKTCQVALTDYFSVWIKALL